jgi:hypothetical protein
MARNRSSVRAELPAGFHRDRDHRRVSGDSARAELLPAQANRGAALAQASPGDGRGLDPGPGAHARVGIRCLEAVASVRRARAGRADRLPVGRAITRRAAPPG